jgi:hypothetical protein
MGRLDDAFLQGQVGQVRAAATSTLVANAVQACTNGADTDEELPGDLRVGPSAGDESDQFVCGLPVGNRPYRGLVGILWVCHDSSLFSDAPAKQQRDDGS